ncbi:MAG: hypothetical protein DLM60_00010 [Pseudonocardiales bacterium]|nr:MAG: hypothetical protein DLM60_00010 [Pseudonocardiales bacterium]
MDDRRLMLVHAHPDDESSMTGATVAGYAYAGDDPAAFAGADLDEAVRASRRSSARRGRWRRSTG